MQNYSLQRTTLWSFPDRGQWSTHKGDYRGNWSPHVPKNLILQYTKENDIVLDPFLGSGTTLIECKNLGRRGIGFDINEKAIQISQERLKFASNNDLVQIVQLGDAVNLDKIDDSSIDFVCTHPPYANAIKYSDDFKNDISTLDVEQFLEKIKLFANESFRVLKKKKMCAFMMGDIRLKGKVIALGFKCLNIFEESGFTLKEIIIKEQLNCKSTSYWKEIAVKNKFYLLAHEYIFVMEK